MGKVCMPYAQSVQQTLPLTLKLLNRLPGAGLVFDTLLRCQKVRFFSIVLQYVHQLIE